MSRDLREEVSRAEAARVVEAVFETMLGAIVQPSPESDARLKDPLTAAVHYVGSWKGALVLECSARQALEWAARLMPLSAPPTLADAHDGLGELTNMIAGNLKPLLPPGVGLSMPSVVEGADHRLRLPGSQRSDILAFRDGSGVFRVVLVQYPEK